MRLREIRCVTFSWRPQLPVRLNVSVPILSCVRTAVAKLDITYPVMLDADYSYWRAMDNQYWPAFYLIDAQGRIAAQAIGEMHVGEPRAKEFEAEIDKVIGGS